MRTTVRIKCCLYRIGQSQTLHVSQITEDKDAWMHKDDLRVSEAVEIDFPDRDPDAIKAEATALRLRRIARHREELEKLTEASL